MNIGELWANLSEAALQADALEPVLESWCAHLGADGFIWNDLPAGAGSVQGLTRHTSAAFRHARFMAPAEALRADPRVARVQANPNRVMVTSREFGSRFGLDEMHRRVLVGELGTPFTMGCLVTPRIAPPGEVPAAMLALHRTRQRGDFDQAHVLAVEAALPAMQHLLKLRHHFSQLAMQLRRGEAALSALPEAVVWLQPGRRILWANLQAEQMLRRASPLTCRDGVLDGVAGAQRPLRAALHDAETGGLAVDRLLSDASGESWLLSVAPTHDHGAFSPQPWARGTLLLRCVPLAGASSAPAPRRLQALFGLTPTEAALTAALARGLNVAEYAAEAGIRMTTARYHVRAVLDKTGSRDLQALHLLLGRLRAH